MQAGTFTGLFYWCTRHRVHPAAFLASHSCTAYLMAATILHAGSVMMYCTHKFYRCIFLKKTL